MEQQRPPEMIELPAPTAWPMVLAFGLMLLFGGLATSGAISALGVLASFSGLVGWFREVLPHGRHEQVRIEPAPPAVSTARREVDRVQGAGGSTRAWLPVEIYPVSAGLKGGLAGGLMMAILALLYGVVTGKGIWYPVNLLSAGFFPASTAELARFQLTSTVIAIAIHVAGSVAVGLLYGAMLPILPRRPILLGGFIAPLLWSGLLHSIIGIINPVLNEHLDWFWFVVTQIGFGVVAGLVVSTEERIRTWQGAPFAVRAGLEGSGLEHAKREESER